MNNTQHIQITLEPGAKMPARATEGAIGYDLCSNAFSFMLRPGERKLVPTGVHIALPHGMAGLVLPRSGRALREGLTCLNSPGLADPDYRGGLGVLLINLGAECVQVEPGDRIAQLVFVQCALPELVVTESLPETKRGESGWGSTGVADKGLQLVKGV